MENWREFVAFADAKLDAIYRIRRARLEIDRLIREFDRLPPAQAPVILRQAHDELEAAEAVAEEFLINTKRAADWKPAAH